MGIWYKSGKWNVKEFGVELLGMGFLILKAGLFFHFWMLLWEYEHLELLQPFCDHEASQPKDKTYKLRLAEQKDRNDP